MNAFRFPLALVALALTSVPAAAVDLHKIDRVLTKEPAYRSKKPKYCLLVFGPEARTRVWLVLDDDVLYIDRNGNGDLTEEGERLRAHHVSKDARPESPVGKTREFFDPDFLDVIRKTKAARGWTTLKGTDRYTLLRVQHRTANARFLPKSKAEKEYLQLLRKDPVRVGIAVGGNLGQVGDALLADRPQDAPIIHFDGPLTFGLHDYFDGRFQRGGEGTELGVRLTTPGLGERARTRVEHTSVPKDAHPIAEIEFPSRRPGGSPIKARFVLVHRC